MSDLVSRQCKPCSKGEAPLSPEQAKQHLSQIDPDWKLAGDAKSIARTYTFSNYYETMAFVNAAALVAHQQDHHPDMTVSYNKCRVEYSTHSIGGLSMNDFICAAKTDRTLKL